MMNQKKIGQFIKELRKSKEITQEQLAETLNVSGRTVSRWETGNNLPDISLLVGIADFFDVDVRELIEGERKSEMMEEDVSGMCHMLMAAGCCCPPRDALQKPWVLQEPGESSTPELGSLFLLQCLSSALY